MPLGVVWVPISEVGGLAAEDDGASKDDVAAEPGCLLLEGDLDLEFERPHEAPRYLAWASGS